MLPPTHSVPVGQSGLSVQCVRASIKLAAQTNRKSEMTVGLWFCDGSALGDSDGGFVCLVGLDVGG